MARKRFKFGAVIRKHAPGVPPVEQILTSPNEAPPPGARPVMHGAMQELGAWIVPADTELPPAPDPVEPPPVVPSTLYFDSAVFDAAVFA